MALLVRNEILIVIMHILFVIVQALTLFVFEYFFVYVYTFKYSTSTFQDFKTGCTPLEDHIRSMIIGRTSAPADAHTYIIYVDGCGL